MKVFGDESLNSSSYNISYKGDRFMFLLTVMFNCNLTESESRLRPDILVLKMLFHVTFSYTSASSNTSFSSFLSIKISICIFHFSIF
jgi:hypothetical protein